MERKFEKKFAYPISTVYVLLTRPSCEWEIFWRMIFTEIIISEILREIIDFYQHVHWRTSNLKI